MAVRPPKPDFMGEEAWEALVTGRHALIESRKQPSQHAAAYLQTNGGEGTDITQGGPTCLLWSTGAKSGKERCTPLNYYQDGDKVYVVGSLAGLDVHPHWVKNLEAKPEGEVQIYDKRWAVKARKISGAEREKLWPTLTAHFPLWGHFQKYQEREFQVFELTPR
ncbi:MAG: nitroreductase family deazaflavin-dependent oxidoreductase [Dehalococcoidia bacterium]|nr:nitroreductase family deazaflavin-dependent oxidoreductase [Dehalococcoidia bacterium]